MWEILEKIKNYLLKMDFTNLSNFTEKNVVLGVVDLSRYENDIIVSVIPDEEQDAEESFLDGQGINLSFTITVLCRGQKQEILIKNICEYSRQICNILREDCTLGGIVDNLKLEKRKYFLDAGPTSEQMTAVEIPLTVLYEEIF